MKIRHLAVPVAFAAMLVAASTAFAQPVTKLTRDLPAATVAAIWCSSLFFEESFYWDEGSDDSFYYEDMAYDLGFELDEVMSDFGLLPAESEEIWAIFDEAAVDLALEDEDGYFAALDACEEAYVADKIKLR